MTGVERVWARRERVGGWHAASRLPKPVELAVAAGSVLLLCFDQPPPSDGLLALSGRGIGLRRSEGFGALRVSTTAWTHPVCPETADTGEERVPDQAEAYARLLLDTGHGPWFVDNLRPYVEELSGHHGTRHAGVLERPRLQRLTPYERDAITAMLLTAPVDVLDRTLGTLSALNRLLEKETARP